MAYTYLNSQQIARQLETKRDQILELLQEMECLLQSADNSHAVSQAEAYWIPHATMALTKEHQWCGGSMIDCQDTIDHLAEQFDEE